MVLEITCGYTSVPIYGSKFRNFGGVKKIGQRFEKTEPLDSKPHQTPRGLLHPPKMVPPYSLDTCPPTTPKTLWHPITPSSSKHWFSEDPWFWPKYSNDPEVTKNATYVKIDQTGVLGDVSSCLETKFDKKISNGKCPKLPKRDSHVLCYWVV